MSKFELSLDAGYVPDWTIVDAVREYFQNALDQAAVVKDNQWSYIYSHATGTLVIANKASVLEAKSLLLGSTSKKDDNRTIGTHGEGYKVATLVALRLGKKVTIYNYGKGEVWNPKMVKSRKYKSDILVFFVDKYIIKTPPNNNLSIEIDGITEDEWELIEQSNLHIQESSWNRTGFTKEKPLGEVKQTSMGRILMEKRFAGKIYVNGLFVRDENDMKYGYDILPKYLKLDRDRKMVTSFDLQWFTSKMWAEVNDKDLLTVAKEKTGDVRYLGDQSYIPVAPEIKKAAYDDFRKEYGEKAIPVTDQSDLVLTQAQYEDAVPVIVPKTQKRLITEAPGFIVKARHRHTETKEERIAKWFDKIYPKLTKEERKEFLDIMGWEDKEQPEEHKRPYVVKDAFGNLLTDDDVPF